jgi:CubicO group peptidase (beta-lactamase class C family)
MNDAPLPAHGHYAPGFEPVARTFSAQLARGEELGASFAVYHRGVRVVHLWGGVADALTDRAWTEDTRALLFSVTKGLVSMGLMLLVDRGLLDPDAPVARYWPGFARANKQAITVRTLLSHRAGLCALDRPLSYTDVSDDAHHARVLDAIESQAPNWEPGREQGYHALTFGLYARELFERIAREPIGAFLRRELFGPLGADVDLGTPASVDGRMARIAPPSAGVRLGGLVRSLARRACGDHDEPITEARVGRTLLQRDGYPRRAFENPSGGGVLGLDTPEVWRGMFASAAATGTADGLARAYLPFALGGEVDGRRYLHAQSIAPLHERDGWSERDHVLQKPIGWTLGFVKEEPHLFSPVRESFGHPGLGGALGWCDPVNQLTIGYVMNSLSWRVRSPRALALCHALYACEPIRDR